MITALIIIFVGFLLIFVEFFLPGGILGAAGGIILAAGLVLFGIHSPNIFLTIGVVVVSVVLLILMVRLTLKRIQNTKAEASFYLRTDQEGYRASKWAEDLVGKTGVALSDMRPAGHVRIEGKQYQAVSRMGYLTKGTEIEIIGGEGGHLVVKKKG